MAGHQGSAASSVLRPYGLLHRRYGIAPRCGLNHEGSRDHRLQSRSDHRVSQTATLHQIRLSLDTQKLSHNNAKQSSQSWGPPMKFTKSLGWLVGILISLGSIPPIALGQAGAFGGGY